MANLSAIIEQKNAADEAWKQQKQAERENASAMQDAAVIEVTQNPEQYAKFLDMQGDNPTYSPGNIVMVMAQNPGATKFGTAERWRSLGRTVINEEKDNGAQIFARQTFSRGYTLTPVYDISQTSGKPLKETAPLEEDTERMEKALTTLLNYSVVPIEERQDIPSPALYSDKDMKLYINPNFSDCESFAGIATEVAHTRFHGKGAAQGYTHEDYDLDAQSVSYILCRRFGVQRERPDTTNLTALYDGFDPQQRRSALNSIQNMAKQIGGSVARNIEPQQKSRTPVKEAR